jgi:hypothetical protein
MRRFAEAVAWLWRLGPVGEGPDPGAVCIGHHDEFERIERMLRGGEVAASVVFVSRPGPIEGRLPSRARLTGTAEFETGSVEGQFVCLHGGGEAAVASSLGVHATREGKTIVFGLDPETCWGALDGYWMWPALRSFLEEALGRTLAALPPVGLLRYDDVPGTAYHQKIGAAKSDRKARRRAEEVIDAFSAAGAKFNIALSSRGLLDDAEVPLDEVWPSATAAYAEAVARGVAEPVCHGYLHLAAGPLARGEFDPREFADEECGEAGRKIDVTMDFIEQTTGFRPSTFVAPTWGYGEGVLEALAVRDLIAWQPPEPGPLLDERGLHETLFSTVEGQHGLDYRPLRAMAEAGVPPTIVLHGGLLDQRMQRLKRDRDVVTAARLSLRRDLHRLPRVEGIEWVGATDLLSSLRAHEAVPAGGGAR